MLLPSFVRIGNRGSFGKRGLFFQKAVEILEILEIPQSMENKGESDHILEILEIQIPPVKRP